MNARPEQDFSEDLTDLPVLGAHFGHVQVLSLKNNQLSQLPQRFLRCFPGVTRVYLSNNLGLQA